MSLNCCSLSARTRPTALTTQQLESPQKVLTTVQSIAAVVAVILAAIGTVGLLHAHGLIYQLPHSLQWIASGGIIGHSVMLGSAGGLILLVFCSAVYCRNTQTQKEDPVLQQVTPETQPPSDVHSDTGAKESVFSSVVTPEPVKEKPPIRTLLDNSSNPIFVTIDPSAGNVLPPTEGSPFPTVEFTLSVQNNEGQWDYRLPCEEFLIRQENGSNSVVGKFIVEGQACDIPLDRQVGRDFQPTGGWVSDGILPNADTLNKKINETAGVTGYITKIQANDLLKDQRQHRAARYFVTKDSLVETTFEIPGLKSVTYQDKIVTFTRDLAIPLASKEQIDLLKNHAVFQEIGEQLASAKWTYTANSPVTSVNQQGNTVVVTYANPQNAITTSL